MIQLLIIVHYILYTLLPVCDDFLSRLEQGKLLTLDAHAQEGYCSCLRLSVC